MTVENHIPQNHSFGDQPRVAKFKRPEPPIFTDAKEDQRYRKGRLALAARIFYHEGWAIGCGVNMTIRDAIDPSTIWMLPAGRPFAGMKSSDLLHIRLSDGGIVYQNDEQRSYDLNAFALHAAIYNARPDIGGIIHGHTTYGKAFSRQNKTVSMIVQDSCTFHDSLPVLPFSAGMKVASDPSPVGAILKKGKGFIMQNRGILLAGKSIECALSYYIRLENLCRAQLLCEAAIAGRGGDLVLVGDEEVKFTYDNTGSEHHAWLMARPYFSIQDRLTGGAMQI